MATRKNNVRFKEIKTHPGYYVGSDGSVWSSFRRLYLKDHGRSFVYVPGGRWKRMKPSPTKTGYLDLSLRRNGSATHCLVHRLVLIAFRGPPPSPELEGAHGNGIRNDNRLDNLRWATVAENQADRIKHGTDNRGTRAPACKLSEAQVLEAIEMRRNGATFAVIAARMGVCYQTISRVCSGKQWGWLTGQSA